MLATMGLDPGARGARAPLLPFLLLALRLEGALLDGAHLLWPLLAESAPVAILDEDRQGRLPRLLPVIVDPAELARVHSQLARHLHLRVRQPVPPPRLDPRPVL